LKENLIDVIALNQFGDLVMVVARIFIGLLAGILCWSLVYNNDEIVLKLAPAIIAAIIGFFIIHCFMAVFEMGVDTVFICFCVDCEKNDGEMNEYYMSPKLMEAMREIKEHAGGSFNFGMGQNAQQPVYVTNVQPNQPYTQQPYPYIHPNNQSYPPQNYQQNQPFLQHNPYPNHQQQQHPNGNTNYGFNV
jgi:Plasma-membrane choline transporter